MDAAATLFNTLQQRVTIRSFSSKPIDDELLNSILETARRSPTSSNMQSYSIIVVKAPETKQKLAVLAGNQKHIETCPVFLAFCADIYRIGLACELHDETLVSSLETTLISSIDAALVGMTTQTLAESLGLGGVMIGAMRNRPREVAELLGLPKGVYVVYGLCLGWPEQIPLQKPRLPSQVMIHHERYQADIEPIKANIAEHNQELAQHYLREGRNLDLNAWSGVIAKRMKVAQRPQLRQDLEALGFSFD